MLTRPACMTLALMAIALAACAPTMTADDPAMQLNSIRQAGDAHDRSAIPALVEKLDSDDPAVRMMAIVALEKITGTRLGYNPYVDRPLRQDAWLVWQEAVTTGRFAQP